MPEMRDTHDQVSTRSLAVSCLKQKAASEEEIQTMANLVLEFSHEEAMKIEAILMDSDAEEALRFLQEVVKPKIRSKRSKELDTGKSTGVMT
jgi:hypothetical protein